MPAKYCGKEKFHRELRLLTPSQFKFVFNNAIPATSQYFTFLARKNTSTNFPRIGITIAKKKVKTAVSRNRIKRLIRESFRKNVNMFPNIDIIVIVKAGCDKLDNEAIFKEIEKSWKRLVKKC